jgi:hypothetical protein
MKFRSNAQIQQALKKLNAAAHFVPTVTARVVDEVAALVAAATAPVVIYSLTPGLLAQRVFSDRVSFKPVPQSILAGGR